MFDSNFVEECIDKNNIEELVSYLQGVKASCDSFWWVKDMYIFSPISYACERNRLDIARELIAGSLAVYGDAPKHEFASVLDPVLTAAGNENKELVSLLLAADYRADIAYKQLNRLGGEAFLKGKVLAAFKLISEHIKNREN